MDKRRELWTIKDLISYTKLPRSTVYTYVAMGMIPAIKIGRHRRFFPEDVDRALRKLMP